MPNVLPPAFFSHMDVARIACIQDAYIVHTRQSIHHVALFLADHCIIERFSQSFVQGSQFHLQKRKFAFPKPAPALNQRFHGFVVKCMPAARIVILSLIPDDAPHPIGSHTAADPCRDAVHPPRIWANQVPRRRGYASLKQLAEPEPHPVLLPPSMQQPGFLPSCILQSPPGRQAPPATCAPYRPPVR